MSERKLYWASKVTDTEEQALTPDVMSKFGPMFDEFLETPDALQMTALVSLVVTVAMTKDDPNGWGKDFVGRFGAVVSKVVGPSE